MSTWRVMVGDCRESMRTLPAESVQCCVTSPPYWGLRDYGHDGQLGLEQTPEAYVAGMVDVFREVRRVLRGDGTLWLNIGDSYASDIKGSGGKANSTLNAKRDASGTVIGKSIVTYTPRRLEHGLKQKDLVGIPWRLAFALQADGWYLRSDIIWAKPNPMPESVTDRPTKAHEYLFLLSKSAVYFYDADAIREPVADSQVGRVRADVVGGASHVERGQHSKGGVYRSGNTARKYGESRDRPGSHMGASVPWEDDGTGRNARSVWTITTQPYAGAHFATFPPELAERCIKAGSKPGDTVLDPFGGSGTTAMVATGHARDAVLCELNPEYVPLIRERCGAMLEAA